MTSLRSSKRWLVGGAAALSVAGLAGGAAAAAALSPSSHPAQLVSAAVAAQADPSTTTAPATDAATAPAKGKRVTDVIDGLVADGTLTQAQGDKVKAAIEAARPQGGRGPGGDRGPGMGGPGMGGPGMGIGGFGGIQRASQALADALGITPDQLRTELQGGKSLADIATAHGKTKQDVVDVLTKQAKAHLDEEVAQGELTQAQADDLLTKATTMIDTAVTTPLPAGFGPGRGHGRGSGKPASDGTTPAAPATTTPSTTTN